MPDSYPYNFGPYGAGRYGMAPRPPIDARWWTYRLADQLDLDPEAVQPVVELRRYDGTGWVLDEQLSRALAGYRIGYGRKTAAGRSGPITATLQLVTARVASLPIGTRLQLALSAPVCAALGIDPDEGTRWTGEVTDPEVNHDAGVTTLVCVGQLGRTSRQAIDTTGWAPSTAADLVPPILTAARTGATAGALGAGGGVLQPPEGVTAAGQLLDALVASTGGQLVEQPAGELDWHAPEHRRGIAPRLTLSAAAVLRRVTWSQSVGDLINVIDVGWAGGSVHVDDPASADPVTGYGPWSASVDTLLTSELDAYDLGLLVVGRRSEPAWRLPDLTVLPDRMHAAGRIDTAQLAALLTMRHAHRVELTGLPAGCPLPGRVIVEGWEEVATARTWQLALAVSDPIQSGVSIRWVDVPDTTTWADIDPAVTWLDVARMETATELL